MNKKRFYIISSTLLLIGLFAGVVQYIGVIDTIYAAINNPGHSWSEMECSTALCIDTTNNRVGVGTMNPTQTLEINGNVKAKSPAADDHLTTKSYVDDAVLHNIQNASYSFGTGTQACQKIGGFCLHAIWPSSELNAINCDYVPNMGPNPNPTLTARCLMP